MAEIRTEQQVRLDILEVTLDGLVRTLDRLVRFNRALISMGAVETPEALEQELILAEEVLRRVKKELRK